MLEVVHRCTNCGKYPFCNYITKCDIPNNCNLWVERGLSDICYKQQEELVQDKKKQ